jgi:hypothetical protein
LAIVTLLLLQYLENRVGTHRIADSTADARRIVHHYGSIPRLSHRPADGQRIFGTVLNADAATFATTRFDFDLAHSNSLLFVIWKTM